MKHTSEFKPAQIGAARQGRRRALRVIKFGGSSLADALCIRRVVDIVLGSTGQSDVVVVVSAMSGVTNDLIDAASRAEAGDHVSVTGIFNKIRGQHARAVNELIESPSLRQQLTDKIDACLQEGERLCQGTMLLRELTLRARDAISSLGERLSAPLVAAALAERGVPSEAVEATELIATDNCHGAADPRVDLTRKRSQNRLLPMLKQGLVPVVTGFIGATEDGVLTTLGRGGSDYSATILGAALDADEVVIWTDVDGMMTSDPRLVHGACTIPEVSYREAAELAHFGAKVLHPKTLRALMPCGIPLWIRNTFSSERPGTKITPQGPMNGRGVTALAAISDAALITIGGPGIGAVPAVLSRTFATASAAQADVLLVSQSSSQNDICLVVSSAVAKRTAEALRREFAQDLAHEKVEHINFDPTVAIVAVVGQNMRGATGIVSRTFGVLGRENVNIIAIALGASECNISFVVPRSEMKAALIAAHREFQLGSINQIVPMPATGDRAGTWYYEPKSVRVDAD